MLHLSPVASPLPFLRVLRAQKMNVVWRNLEKKNFNWATRSYGPGATRSKTAMIFKNFYSLALLTSVKVMSDLRGRISQIYAKVFNRPCRQKLELQPLFRSCGWNDCDGYTFRRNRCRVIVVQSFVVLQTQWWTYEPMLLSYGSKNPFVVSNTEQYNKNMSS